MTDIYKRHPDGTLQLGGMWIPNEPTNVQYVEAVAAVLKGAATIEVATPLAEPELIDVDAALGALIDQDAQKLVAIRAKLTTRGK